MNNQAIEDYLKTIYRLAEIEEPVSTSRIAEAREVQPASVTNMVQRLARLGYANYEKHRGVTLSDSGRTVALRTLRHHRLIELYLTQELGFGWDEVHEEAERLEHVISDKMEARIADVLGHPTADPHGEPIPAADGTMINPDTKPLSSMTSGSRATVSRVSDDSNSELLGYLSHLGILPGTEILVLEVAPFEGPVTVKIDDQQRVVGHKVAAAIYIEER